MIGRRPVALGVLACVLAAAAGGWLAATQIASPAEVAARTAAPEPSPILVPVEQRVVSSEIVTRGTGRFGSPQTVMLTPSSLKQGRNIATWLPHPSGVIAEGEIIARIDDRPVIVLRGNIPMYRDLRQGDTGRDVEQLETALARLGHDPGAVDGVFDIATEAALDELFAHHESHLLAPTADELLRADALAGEADGRQLDALAQQGSVVAAGVEVAAAEAAVATSELAITNLVADRRNIEGPLDQAIVDAQAAHFLAIDARTANIEPGRAAEFDEAVRQSFAAVEAAREARRVAIEEADRAIELARTERDAAQRALDAARAVLTDARGLSDVLEERAVSSADAGAAASSSLLPHLPSDEIVFLPDLPVRVSSVDAQLAKPVAEAVASVTDAIVSVDASLALDEAELVTVGSTVVIDEPDLGIAESGVVSRVDDVPGTMGVDGFHVYMEVVVDGSPPRIAGSSVRLRIPVQSTDEQVLAVPVAALSLAADGSSRVQVQRATGLRFVEVRAGLTANGFVELVEPGSLAVGDLVVVGFDQSPAIAASGQ